ncbi:mechanosensitive ion channel family protein [Falsigemmobacter faecalis]|uniref:Mechanosensitive ion channel family protein n=2 Tax=Falsigemmobacter faecalis TaxID=2488730 RepID=A0A3P3DDD8_9RHOB|nr:mechanosensitive ion channel family protein [Falsigemmobacter faecalis]
METIRIITTDYPWIGTAFWLFALMATAGVVNFVVPVALVKLLHRVIERVQVLEGPEVVRSGVIARLANAAPAIVIYAGIAMVPGLPGALATVVRNVANAVIILCMAMAIVAALDLFHTIWRRRQGDNGRSIKGYVQVTAIIVYIVAALLMIAAVIDRSPLILLSGLGALTAVLILVFQDTLLSLVAAVQISSTDMLKVGDWIEMPAQNANGDVLEIALHTVKVQNFDKTITTVPIRSLVTQPFKNYRAMREAGGRRIKRSLHIDQSTIRYLTEDEVAHLAGMKPLRAYVERKARELAEWNAQLGPSEAGMNRRRLTNIGTFRAYVESYLKAHPNLRLDLTMIVRQLEPGPEGLPIEVYAFSNTVVWVEYEAIQSDIFDHLYGVLPEFGLSVFQTPAGRDLARLTQQKSPRAAPR